MLAIVKLSINQFVCFSTGKSELFCATFVHRLLCRTEEFAVANLKTVFNFALSSNAVKVNMQHSRPWRRSCYSVRHAKRASWSQWWLCNYLKSETNTNPKQFKQQFNSSTRSHFCKPFPHPPPTLVMLTAVYWEKR